MLQIPVRLDSESRYGDDLISVLSRGVSFLLLERLILFQAIFRFSFIALNVQVSAYNHTFYNMILYFALSNVLTIPLYRCPFLNCIDDK